MAQPATQAGQDAEGNTLLSQDVSGVAHAPSTSSRRGSADSFRELLARLKKTNDQVQVEIAREVEAPAPVAEPAATPVDVAPAPIVIEPKANWLAPPPPQPAVAEPVAVDPLAPLPNPAVEAREQERRARMRAEAHAASQEIIARLRKAAGHAAEKKEAATATAQPIEAEAEPPARSAVAEADHTPSAPLVAEAQAEAPHAPAVQTEASAAATADAGNAASASGRRRHPFFPDVYLEDDEADPQLVEATASSVVEELAASQTAQAASEAEPAAPSYQTELPQSAAELAGQPEASVAAPVVAELQPAAPSVEAEAVAEISFDRAEPEPDLAAAQPVAEAAVIAEPQAAEPADGEGHQEDLIEDEAEAVRHLHGMEVKGIGDIAKAVFSAPTPGERAAFLDAIREAGVEDTKPGEVMAASAETLSAPTATVRRLAPADDPFAKIAPDVSSHINHEEPDEDSGELARSLLDMMLSNPSAGLPQERALAADALLKLIPKVPTKALITIAERLSIMESPPNLLIAKLINDPRIEIAGPLLEQCNHISDQVLGKVIATGQISLQRLIARRRHLSAALTDQLIEYDDASVLLTLVRNGGAVISHVAFNKLMQHARHHSDALAPLATRSDLPPTIAFELFWSVPAELRRYLLSRFLTDSETLTKILKITKVMQGGEGSESNFADQGAVDEFMAVLMQGDREQASDLLAAMSGISPTCASRIIGDRQGEPLAVVFKAIGLTRAQFEEYVGKLQQPEVGIISPDRVVLELQSTFNSMSFNKARILLTYWDWAVLKHGPYAEAH